MFAERIRHRRQQLGFSQAQLAQLARVSLPTIHNIESGRSNPCYAVLSQVLETLGLALQFSPRPADWDYLAACGVPLTSKGSREPPLAKRFAAELTYALAEAIAGTLDERSRLALTATLIALRDHYPSTFSRFSKSPYLKQLLKVTDPRLLKLRRLALSGLSRFL